MACQKQILKGKKIESDYWSFLLSVVRTHIHGVNKVKKY